VESGHQGEDRRDDPQQQWGAGHRQDAANKQEYGLCRIKKKRQKVTRTFRQSASSTPFQSWKQKYVFQQRRTNFGVLLAGKAISGGRGMLWNAVGESYWRGTAGNGKTGIF
jgi:hypothetical protein